MYTVERQYEHKFYRNNILDNYFEDKKIGVLDIETTGLSAQKSNLILGGIGFFNEKGFLLKQYFAENINEEEEILEKILTDMCELDIIITYNGKNFDIKYIKARMAELNINGHYPFPYNFDLYLFLNGHSELRKVLPNLKQKTVENFMGLWTDRADEISGAESVELYFEFLTQKKYKNSEYAEKIRDKILLHNSDDVVQLSKLIPVINKSDINKAFFNLGFPVEELIILGIEIKAGELRIWGHQRYPVSFTAYGIDDSPCFVEFTERTGEFYVSLPLLKKKTVIATDIRAFQVELKQFEVYENYREGYLALKYGSDIQYPEVNNFVKTIIKRIKENISKC